VLQLEPITAKYLLGHLHANAAEHDIRAATRTPLVVERHLSAHGPRPLWPAAHGLADSACARPCQCLAKSNAALTFEPPSTAELDG